MNIKKISMLLLPSILLSNEILSLPVFYDPFKKTKKLIIKKEKLDSSLFIKKDSKKSSIQKSNIVLNGMFNNKVIINGKLYEEGEKFGEYEVVKIYKRFVLLKRAKKRIVLPFIDNNSTVYKKEER